MTPCFAELIAVVETRFPTPDAGEDIDAVHAVAADLARMMPDPRAAHAVIADCRAAVAAGRLPHGSSHRHPNGFDKLSLYRSSRSDARIRLHVWWDGGDSMSSAVHDHRWHFASYVLAGRMTATNFREVGAGEPGASYDATTMSDLLAEGRKRGERLGQRRLCATASYAIRGGDVHTLHAEVPHRVIGEAGRLASTLLITAPPIREVSTTYRRRAPDPSPHHYEPFTATGILDRLSALLDALAAPDSAS